MVLRTEAVLLRKIVSEDPIEAFDSEDGGAACHFCGSRERHGAYDGYVFRHFHDCLWLKALILLDMPIPDNHIIYVPPEREPPCATCGWENWTDDHARWHSNGDMVSLDVHHRHLAEEAGQTMDEFYGGGNLVLRSLPHFTSPRGAIRIIPSPDLWKKPR